VTKTGHFEFEAAEAELFVSQNDLPSLRPVDAKVEIGGDAFGNGITVADIDVAKNLARAEAWIGEFDMRGGISIGLGDDRIDRDIVQAFRALHPLRFGY